MHYVIFSVSLVIALEYENKFMSFDTPYDNKSTTDSFNYGYWFKYQPLNLLGIKGRFNFFTNTTKTVPNRYLLSAEVSSENTLTMCHYSLDNYDHVIEILKSSGTDTYKYTFSFDKYLYEGYWNFFGIQKYKGKDDEYQIIFVRQLPYTNYDIKTFPIKDFLVRQTQQNYYIGWFGMVKDFKGLPVYFKQFKGKLTTFIDLPDVVAGGSLDFNKVIEVSPKIFYFSDGTAQTYFDTLFLDGLSYKKYSYTPYREGIRYGISMWVKSQLVPYSVPMNYTLLRATINEYYQDSYMGDKQLYIQYQTSLNDIDNNIFLSSYTYETPVYSVLKQDSVATIKLLNDIDYQTELKNWHFMQFEQGRVYDLTATPKQYNTLFLFHSPKATLNGKKNVQNDFGRLNFHFSGVPMYFYVGGGLYSNEYKFVGSISKLKFETSNFQDLTFSILCHGSCNTCVETPETPCKTCTGPTSNDCSECNTSGQNRELSLGQCLCKQGYVLDIFNTLTPFVCVLRSSQFPTMTMIETQYSSCDVGYDQCKENIVCSYGYFKFNNLCFQCPQQPSIAMADQIFCTECMFNWNEWTKVCETNLLRTNQLVFQSYKTQTVTFKTEQVDSNLQLFSVAQSLSTCQDGYGYDTINKLCLQCQTCLQCSFKNYKQVCQICPSQYYLDNDKCVQCGFNCMACDQNGCNICQANNFLTLDRYNCQICAISNCLYCYQYYQDGSQLTISLDIDFQKVDLTLDKVKTGCARCKDSFYIKNDQCSPFTAVTDATKYANCQTGIEKDDGSFQCLIGTDKTKAIQYSQCTEISNCKSCFVAYPTKPWCVECNDGYYVQLEDGICVPCPGNCGNCVKQNSLTKDSWKANIRALYYQKFSTHTYESYALDFSSYSYETICKACKSGYILSGETCIQSCGSYCKECSVRNGKAVCIECLIGQFGKLQSVDGNQQCLECPTRCTACVQRSLSEYSKINDQFDISTISKYENRCYLADSTYFLDNEVGMPVECLEGRKCYKSMIFTMNIYCASLTGIDSSNFKACLFSNIQSCLSTLFGDVFVEYSKQSVIKEFTLKLVIQDSSCLVATNITITQNLSKQILSLNKTTLIIQPAAGTVVLALNGNLTLQNFKNYQISGLNIQSTQNSTVYIYGQNVNLNQIQMKRNDIKAHIENNFILYNLYQLEIQNMQLDSIQRITKYFIEVVNQATNNVILKLQDVQITSSNFTIFGLIRYNTTVNNLLQLNILNLQARLTLFYTLNCFISAQSAKITPNLTNLVLENNTFYKTQFLQFYQVIDPILNTISFRFNSFNQTEVIIIPVINIQSCSFTQNVINQSRLIQNNGTLINQNNNIIFKVITISQNSFTIGSQFIVIIQNEQSNLTVTFTDLNLIKNTQIISKSSTVALSYEISLIYLSVNYVYFNNFNINRASGGVDLSIISTLEIIIKNYNIFTDGLFQTVTNDKACLTAGSYNFSMYVFDLKYFELNTFTVNYVLSTDYPIIIIQSQSGLKKQQNEQIKILNGIITNNTLLIKEINRQSSVIQIKSEQVQQIYVENVNFTQNLLNEYVQDQDKVSASTLLIQSSQGQVNIQKSQFQNNYVINSTNSPLFIQSLVIKLADLQFTNNNVFDLIIIKTFLQLKYLISVSLEQIYVQDFPIQSNGGSGQFIGQTISFTNITVSGSYAQNGGSFYITTIGQSLVNITDCSFILSRASEFMNSNGGVLYLDGQQSNLKCYLKNIQVKYAKSRKSGGFMYASPSNLTLNITNLECINCFSLNGGALYIASTDEQIIPRVLLQNTSLQNPDARWFLQTLTSLTSDEILILQRQSFLIYLYNTILEVQQLIVTNGNLFGILYFDGNNGLIINNTNIEGYSPYQIPLVTISHSSTSQKYIKLANMKIENIVQEQMSSYDCNSSRIIQFNSPYQCKIPEQQLTTSYQSNDYLINNYQCNQKTIYQKITEYVSAVQINNFTTNYLLINNFSIINVVYNKLDYGILCIRDFSAKRNQIKLRNLRFINNSCVEKGCLLIAQSIQDLYQTGRLLQQQVESTSKATVKIYDSHFLSNSAKYGAGIYILNTSALVMNTFFQHNVAEMLGGAIYFNSLIYSLELINNQILNNTAKNQSGSGIYLLNQPMPYLKGLNNIIFDNVQDFNEIPQTLQLKLNGILLNKYFTTNDSEQLIEEVQVTPYKILGQSKLTDTIMLPSGQSIKDYQYFDENTSHYIPYNITLRFIVLNSQQQQLQDQNVVINISARTNNETFSTSYFSKHQFVYDNETQSINLDDLIIYYSPYESSSLEVKVESVDVFIPVYSTEPPYSMISSKSYEFMFFIKTFQCQLGQFFNSTSQSCEQCSGSTYSVQKKSKVCVFKDDAKIQTVQSARIELKPGYWRAYVESVKIDECFHLSDNCVGGWGVGNDLCHLGHIGALCEQCDLYNIRGSGAYSVSVQYSCGACSGAAYNAITIVLISLWTFISIIMSVDSTIEIVKDHIQKSKFISLGLIFSDPKPNPAILIKVLSNYLQIITTITTFQLQVPPGISSIFQSAGNPISQMSYSLDCFLVDFSDINIIYFRIIWGLILAALYISVYLIGYMLMVFLKKVQFNIAAITTCFIYLYIFLQPNLVGSLISLVSFRLISSEYWISGNVSYRYDTVSHAIWLLTFVLPTLIIIGLVLPIALWYGIYKNRHNLNDSNVKQIWGYLYNEYRLGAYYWETIKIIQKEFIIIVLAYYEDYIPIKAALVFVSLFFYSFVTNIKKPYSQGLFNQLDSEQTTVCAVSIVLATTIYTAQVYQLQEIIWPFYLIIGILNLLFVVKLVIILIFAYLLSFQTQIDGVRDKIADKYPSLIYDYSFLRPILENSQERKKRIKDRFQQIRQYLIPQAKMIIQFKKQLINPNNRDNKINISQKQIEITIPTKKQYIRYNQVNQESPVNIHDQEDGNAQITSTPLNRIIVDNEIDHVPEDVESVNRLKHIQQLQGIKVQNNQDNSQDNENTINFKSSQNQ